MHVMSLMNESGLAIMKAAEVLRYGGVLAFPTETTYGLGCDPRNQAALGKIYRLKRREPQKTLPLVASSLMQVEELFEMTEKVRSIAKNYWPGPLTILLQPKDLMMRKSAAVYRDGYSAVRVTSYEPLRRLVESYGFPLTATSANHNGEENALSVRDVMTFFADEPEDLQPDLVLDGGDLAPSQPSTIIKISVDGDIEIIRQGKVSIVSSNS